MGETGAARSAARFRKELAEKGKAVDEAFKEISKSLDFNKPEDIDLDVLCELIRIGWESDSPHC
mgnify:CR=1 FL=1